MKRWIKLFLMLFMGACMLAGIGAVCQSCDQMVKHHYWSSEDSEKVCAIVAENIPVIMQSAYEFDDVTDALCYKQERERQLKVDSVFASLPDQTIANVVSVLSKRRARLSVSTIIAEYNMNKSVYDGLPQPDRQRVSQDSTKLIPYSSSTDTIKTSDV